MEIKNLIIESELEEYLQSKGDIQKFINFCIRERRDKMDANWQKKMAMPADHKDKTWVDPKYRKFLPDDQIVRTDTPFYKKNIVISGTLERYEYRNSLAALLHPYGVAVNSGIISKTNIAIFGKDAGPKKREQVRELNASGSDIVVVDEAELYTMIDTILQ